MCFDIVVLKEGVSNDFFCDGAKGAMFVAFLGITKGDKSSFLSLLYDRKSILRHFSAVVYH